MNNFGRDMDFYPFTDRIQVDDRLYELTFDGKHLPKVTELTRLHNGRLNPFKVDDVESHMVTTIYASVCRYGERNEYEIFEYKSA